MSDPSKHSSSQYHTSQAYRDNFSRIYGQKKKEEETRDQKEDPPERGKNEAKAG